MKARRRVGSQLPARRLSYDWLLTNAIPEPNTGCLLWLGSTSEGYAAVGWKRLAPLLLECKPGEYALHKCDNRICIEPTHLYKGTQKDNIRDMFKRGRVGDRTHKHLRSIKDDIYQAYTTGEPKTYKEVAEMFGVHETTVWRLVQARSRQS